MRISDWSSDVCSSDLLSLFGQRFWDAEIVEAEIRWKVWLVVPSIAGFGAGHIGPFGEARPPPAVILLHGVRLRQVKCQRPHATPLLRSEERRVGKECVSRC